MLKIATTVSSKVKEQLESMAAAEGRSLSNLLRLIVERYLEGKADA